MLVEVLPVRVMDVAHAVLLLFVVAASVITSNDYAATIRGNLRVIGFRRVTNMIVVNLVNEVTTIILFKETDSHIAYIGYLTVNQRTFPALASRFCSRFFAVNLYSVYLYPARIHPFRLDSRFGNSLPEP